jgi:hypothetical protein
VEWRWEVRDGAPRVVRLGLCSSDLEGKVQQKHLRRTEVAALMTIYAASAVRLNADGTVDFGTHPEGRPRAAATRRHQRVTLEPPADSSLPP